MEFYIKYLHCQWYHIIIEGGVNLSSKIVQQISCYDTMAYPAQFGYL